MSEPNAVDKFLEFVRDNVDKVSLLLEVGMRLGFTPDELMDMTVHDLVALIAVDAELTRALDE